ncbi:MAG: DMT family transporter [Deltaproteobacteria bacterium]|nr:DMT family transporter [Deltaproteobacteria bacterium]
MNNHEKPASPVQIDPSFAGPLFMLSAAMLFTLLNLFIKLLGPAFSVWHIGFFRFFGGLIVLLAIFGRRRNPFKGNSTRLLLIRGCVGSIAFISLITAIRMLPLSTALVIFYSFPAFSAVFSFIIFGERISRVQIACIAAVVMGIGIIFDFRLAGGLIGQTAALVGSVFAGLTVTLIRSLRENNGPVIIYLYFCTMGAIVTFPMFIMNPVFPSTAAEWVMIFGIIFSSVTAQLLMNQGFFYCRGWEGGVFMSSEVIFTACIGIIFLGDPASLRFWTGGSIVFASIVALNRLKSNGQASIRNG